MSKNVETRFFEAVFYGQLHGVGFGTSDYDKSSVTVEWLQQFFTNRTIQTICVKYEGSHDGENACQTSYGSGLHLYADEIPVGREHYRLKVRAVSIDTPSLLDWLDIEVPEKFWGVFDWFTEEPGARESAEFQAWRETVAIAAPVPLKTTVETGRKATIQKTSPWVTKLVYTPAEAAAEIARINAANLSSRSRAAFKAHVTRRVVA